jgi:hypothetical protein
MWRPRNVFPDEGQQSYQEDRSQTNDGIFRPRTVLHCAYCKAGVLTWASAAHELPWLGLIAERG